MAPYSPSTATLFLVAIFAILYLAGLLRKAARRQIDLYDLLMLSMVAVIPLVFTFVPGLADWTATAAGVSYPFVVMFGVLFAVLFLLVHRLTAKLHAAEDRTRRLIQELSLLRAQVDGDCVARAESAK